MSRSHNPLFITRNRLVRDREQLCQWLFTTRVTNADDNKVREVPRQLTKQVKEYHFPGNYDVNSVLTYP